MSKFKLEAISFIKTFISGFLTVLAAAIVQLPIETLSEPETYKASFFVGLVLGAVRTALSLTWQKTLPVSVGGKK